LKYKPDVRTAFGFGLGGSVAALAAALQFPLPELTFLQGFVAGAFGGFTIGFIFGITAGIRISVYELLKSFPKSRKKDPPKKSHTTEPPCV
jgi:hypothetical protein